MRGIIFFNKIFMSLSKILLCVLMLSACTSKNKSLDTFVFCSVGSPSSFNPQLATDGPTFNASSSPLYNRLVDFSPGTTQLVPSLAESWEVKNKLEYIFKLRKGVKFHTTEYFRPTRDFNADDVVFTFNRQLKKDHPFHKVGGGVYKYFESMGMEELIKAVEKVDAYTVKFVLSRPESPFLANLGMDFASILSKEYADQLVSRGTLENIDTDPIGTGPYVFKKYVKDSVVRFEANSQYFQGKPKINKMVFAITTDPNVRTQKLLARECHLLNEPAPQDIEKIQQTKGLEVVQAAGLNVGYLAMNTQKQPFDNVLVRRAMNHALNREAYLNAIYHNKAVLASNPLPPTVWSYHKDLKSYEYNVSKAKELLIQAGYPNGFETELWTLPVSRPYNPDGRKMGEMMQADLAKVGIKVKLVTYDWSTYLEKTRNGEHSLAQLGWSGDNGDPDNFLNILLSCNAIKGGNNVSRWCNKEYTEIIEKARQVSDNATRTNLYLKAQEIFAQEVPWVPLAHATVYKGKVETLAGYQINPLSVEKFFGLQFVSKP